MSTLTVESMLADLRKDWSVALTSSSEGWCLTIRSERNLGTEHTYRGASLKGVVGRAWAGG